MKPGGPLQAVISECPRGRGGQAMLRLGRFTPLLGVREPERVSYPRYLEFNLVYRKPLVASAGRGSLCHQAPFATGCSRTVPVPCADPAQPSSVDFPSTEFTDSSVGGTTQDASPTR